MWLSFEIGSNLAWAGGIVGALAIVASVVRALIIGSKF
jgi:hypothetical protein